MKHFFERIKQEHAENESGAGIRSFCRTRWTVRGESIGSKFGKTTTFLMRYGINVYKIS